MNILRQFLQILRRPPRTAVPVHQPPTAPDHLTASSQLSTHDPKGRARLALLARFTKPSELAPPDIKQEWLARLGVPYDNVIRAFVSSRFLRQTTLTEQANLLLVPDLKRLLKQAGLKVSGTKPELIDRLSQQAYDQLAPALRPLPDRYVCTDAGGAEARRYTDEFAARELQAKRASFDALQSGKPDLACRLKSDLDAWSPYHHSNPLAVSDSPLDLLTTILRLDLPPAIAPPPGAALACRLKAAAAWQSLWGRLDDALELAGVDAPVTVRYENDIVLNQIESQAICHMELERYRASPDIISAVEIMGAEDSCPACERLAKRSFRLPDVPALPYHRCTNDMGCRCCYAPVVR